MRQVVAPIQKQRPSVGPIKGHDGFHVLLDQLEVENLEVLLDPRRGHALRDHHQISLQREPNQHLGKERDSDKMFARFLFHKLNV